VTADSPVVLVVEQDFRELPALSERLVSGKYRLATCPVEAVALEYVRESSPAAVLLDARTLYLEGPACLDRW
jgi:DNA-binding response OmpR family regulator